MVGKTDTC